MIIVIIIKWTSIVKSTPAVTIVRQVRNKSRASMNCQSKRVANRNDIPHIAFYGCAH